MVVVVLMVIGERNRKGSGGSDNYNRGNGYTNRGNGYTNRGGGSGVCGN